MDGIYRDLVEYQKTCPIARIRTLAIEPGLNHISVRFDRILLFRIYEYTMHVMYCNNVVNLASRSPKYICGRMIEKSPEWFKRAHAVGYTSLNINSARLLFSRRVKFHFEQYPTVMRFCTHDIVWQNTDSAIKVFLLPQLMSDADLPSAERSLANWVAKMQVICDMLPQPIAEEILLNCESYGPLENIIGDHIPPAPILEARLVCPRLERFKDAYKTASCDVKKKYKHAGMLEPMITNKFKPMITPRLSYDAAEEYLESISNYGPQ